jgi:hypothetical protein
MQKLARALCQHMLTSFTQTMHACMHACTHAHEYALCRYRAPAKKKAKAEQEIDDKDGEVRYKEEGEEADVFWVPPTGQTGPARPPTRLPALSLILSADVNLQGLGGWGEGARQVELTPWTDACIRRWEDFAQCETGLLIDFGLAMQS